MRHFDQLASDVRDALFHQPPQSFDRDSERSVLAQALGATLYVPATKDGLAGAVRRQASFFSSPACPLYSRRWRSEP